MSTATYTNEPPRARESCRRDRSRSDGSRSDDGERLAKALGVFSVGLGLTQILAPRVVARAIGLDDDDDNRRTMRRRWSPGRSPRAWGCSTRSGRQRSPGAGYRRPDGSRAARPRLRVAPARSPPGRGRTAAVAGVMVLDILACQRLSREGDGGGTEARPRMRGIRVHQAITIDRSPEELYRLLARPGESAPLHGPPGVGARAGPAAIVLEGARAARHDRRVDG